MFLSGKIKLGILISGVALMINAEEQKTVPVLPVSQWTVHENPGDNVKLKVQDGVLAVDFDINVNKTHQIGHKTLNQVPCRLLLKTPIPLDDKHRRIIFEASGLDEYNPDSNKQLLICPVIIDENGEYLIYKPNKYPHLKTGGTGWSKWMSTDFFAGEAGGATQDVFEAEGGDQNSWPDGKLAFAGFQVNVRKPEFGRQKGTVYLGEIEIAGVKIPSEDPYGYADSFFKKDGGYKLAFAVRNEFQGIPINEGSQTISYDPGSVKSRKQKLIFPLGPNDNYWINYQITDTGGNVVVTDFMRYQITAKQGDSAKPKPVDVAKEPVLGYLRINVDRGGSGVYEQGKPLVVNVRVFPKGAKQLTLDWQLKPWSYTDTLDQGKKAMTFSNDKYQDVAIKLKPQAGRDAYKLELLVKDGGKTVDSQTYCLGYKTDFTKSHDREGKLTDRNEIKKNTYNRTTYLPKRKGLEPEAQGIKHFRTFLMDTKQAADNFTYMVDIADFEVLPGVFEFSFLDNVMDAAADYGCKVTVRLAHADKNVTYRWPKYSRQHNYDGTEIDQHYYGAYAVADPRMTKLWLDAYRALYDRYGKHTAFQGYYVMLPGGEWCVVDKPWQGMIAGYSDVTGEGFRDFLQNNMKLNLKELNKRWKTDYKTWNDVAPPMPDLKSGSTPDLRMQWVDFNRFKASLSTDFWFPLAINSIRKYDKKRVTIIYGSPNKYKNLYGKLDYCHNGGNHYGNKAGEFVDAWEKGKIGWITEPHHPHRWAAYGDPAEKGWVLDWSVWVMTSQAGGGGANLHIYYIPNPTLDLAAHYGGAYAVDRFEIFKPILEELITIKLQEPPIEVAVMQDPYTLYCKHRTTFGARLDDLKRWYELLKTDSINFENFSEDRQQNYKLLLPNILDEVMSEKNVDSLNKLVRNGAKMIMTANTGKYVPELGTQPFQLLRKLKITPPQGTFVQNKTGVVAQVNETNPLFKQGDKLPFFTLADLQKDLQSDSIKKDFWKYPYRWIPQTDYFGFYPENKTTNGKILARFPDGGVAMSLHQVGKGEVIVFWGIPDMRDDKLKGMMAKAGEWADAISPRRGSPIPRTLEAHSDMLKRHYALLYQETPGTYTQKLSTVPDGKWFLDDMVSGQKLGTYNGEELRSQGLAVTFVEGYSPLKIIRMMPLDQMQAKWLGKYREPAK